MEYTLSNSFTKASGGAWDCFLAGCGGTGGFLAEGLCRLLPPVVQIVLVDFDRVEEKNLKRQNFYRGEIGKYKSLALAERLSEKYDRPVAYCTLPIEKVRLRNYGLIVSCVDNGVARAAIADQVTSKFAWWIDAGNGDNYGQILVGNSDIAQFMVKQESVLRLPLPSLQRPEILLQGPPEPDCAEVETQGPTINQTMAALTLEVIRKLVKGTLPWMQLLIDAEYATLTPVMATPENCREIMHTTSKEKIQIIEKEE